jgi:hypothetical protein
MAFHSPMFIERVTDWIVFISRCDQSSADDGAVPRNEVAQYRRTRPRRMMVEENVVPASARSPGGCE